MSDAGELLELRDGSAVRIRPIRASDKQLLLAGFEQLSAESRYRRFFGPVNHLGTALLTYLTEVDHFDHEALVAVGADTGEPVGVARYIRAADHPEVAEVAVTVVDPWQGRGVATELLERLVERARDAGIERFSALCLAENKDVIDLIERLGVATKGPRRTGSSNSMSSFPLPATIHSIRSGTRCGAPPAAR